MHDFGEYLPFDAVLYNKNDPMYEHNNYPALWTLVVEEALSEVENGGEIVPFMRAATGASPAHARLYWMGD